VESHLLKVVRRELGPSDAEAKAASLMLIYQGLLLLSRAGLLSRHHQDAIRQEFIELRRAKEHRS
jgi:TetR/AcrR family transcriptional regulator, transcriptional repressor for nem operon